MRSASLLLLAALVAAGEALPTIHVTSERPWYRPGETACLRAVVLDAVSRAPLDAKVPVCLRVRDGRGQAVWTGLAEVVDGVAAAGWPVPELGGAYTVEAAVGTRTAAEPRRILVARATGQDEVAAEISFDRRGYAPGDTAAIDVVLRDRAGAPLPGQAAVVRVALADGSPREERVVSDAQGRARISLAIPAELARRDGTVTASLPGPEGGIVASRSIPLASARLELRAEVEGGTLVAGRPAAVYLQARGEDGRPVDCRGAVVDGAGRPVAPFAVRHEGRCRIVFTPAAGTAYRLACAAPVAQELPLPAVLAEGAAIAGDAIQSAGQPLRLRVAAPPGSRLAVLRRGQVLAEVPVPAGDDLAVDPGGAGVMDAVVRDAAGAILAQRTLFRRPARAIALALEAPAVAAPDEAVTVALRLTGPDGRPVPGLCSLSAVEAGDEDLLEARERPPRLPALAWLDGEVEELADAGGYLADDAAAQERLDLLLGVQGWRRGQASADAGRFRRLCGEAPILRGLLAPALDTGRLPMGVVSEMGGAGAFMAIGAGGGGAGLFGSRSGGGRLRSIAHNGGSRASENSVQAALRFLKLLQSPDGRWSADAWPQNQPAEARADGVGTWTGPSADRCGTALAVLSFLGTGYDHKTPNRFRPQVRKGLEWLLGQSAGDGMADADPVVQACIAMALAEAYAMTSDPEMRGPAQQAVAGVLRLQHAQGGWAASGRSDDARLDAGVSAWCVMALRSAYSGGLSVGEGLSQAKGYLEKAWRAANPDGRRSGVFPGTWDAASGTAHEPDATAAGAVMAVYLGHRCPDPLLDSMADRLLTGPPAAVPMDPMTLYWGNLALFQVAGERWQQWNAIVRDLMIGLQRRDVPCDGSWDPAVFGATGARWGRPVTSAICCLSLEVYYRYATVKGTRFMPPPPMPADLRLRLDAGRPDAAQPPGTLAWWAAEPTAADGRLQLRLPPAGRGRHLVLRADAMDAAGGFAAAERVLEIRAAAGLSVRLPGSLLVGDRWDAPCVARGAEPRAESTSGACAASLDDGRLRLTALEPGVANVRVSAGDEQRTGAVLVLPGGAPWMASGQQVGSAVIALPPASGFLPGGLEGAIVVERGFDALLDAVHAQFSREPHGCFEQTSSTSHPLALSLLRRRSAGRSLDEVAPRHLAAAVARLQGFACPSGGYSMFGHDPGDPVLTAYGLRQFRALGQLTGIDQALQARQLAWLLRQRTADGGFRPGAATADAGLCQVQISADLGTDCPPDDRKRAYAAAGRLGTAYALGLAARLARECGDGDAAALMARVRRQPDGQALGPGGSPWRPQAAVEATALAVLDSLAAGRDEEARRGLAWLGTQRRGAAWDITQANVLAIEAFAAAERLLPFGAEATLVVSQAGRPVGTLQLPAAARGLLSLPLRVDPAAGPVEVAMTGTAQPWRWQLAGRLDRPQDGPNAPLALTLGLPPRLAVGQPCELLAQVRASAAVYAPLLRIGIPAGLEPRAEALDLLVRSRRIACWESLDGELRIYGEGLAAGATWDVPIACVAIAAGAFRGRASSAHPFYEPGRSAWQAGVAVEVTR